MSIVKVFATLASVLVIIVTFKWSIVEEINVEPERAFSYVDLRDGFRMECSGARHLERNSFGIICYGAHESVIAAVSSYDTTAADLSAWMEEYRRNWDYVPPEAVTETNFAGRLAYRITSEPDPYDPPGTLEVRYHLLDGGKAYEISLKMSAEEVKRFESGFRLFE